MKPEQLIGRKVRGFKFEKHWNRKMNAYIGLVGLAERIFQNKMVLVLFDNGISWSYPADQIEAHLVEENEIPTLTKESTENDLLQHIKFCLECKNEYQAIRLIEKYGFQKQNINNEEIPTLSDGVMMWVSDDGEYFEKRYIYFKNDNKVYRKEKDGSFIGYKYYKPLEPTKEEQLTAILGNSDKVAEIMELFNDKK